MPMTLAEMEAAVQKDLDDVSAAVWTTDQLARAIRKALFRYSDVRPQEAIGTLVAANSREYALAALTGLVDVQRVWWPYDASAPAFPPQWVEFEVWDDKTILFVKSDPAPTLGAAPLRVFYTKQQAIKDLDSATASTFPAEDEECLILGACGWAAVQRARTSVDAVNPSANTPDLWSKWGQARLVDFERELKEVARRVERYHDARVGIEWPDKEKFDDKLDGSRWA